MSADVSIGSVSCICITENREKFLPRAIDCFLNQYYEEKELLIFYDPLDVGTESVATSFTSSNWIRLDVCSDVSQGIYIEQIDEPNTSLENQVYLKTSDGFYLHSLPNGSIAISKERSREGTGFIFERTDDNISFLSIHNLWLTVNENGRIFQVPEKDTWEYFVEEESGKLKSWLEWKMNLKPRLSIDYKTIWQTTSLREADSKINFIQVNGLNKLPLGERRNIGTDFSSGDYLCVWDDDDWYNPNRISEQAMAIYNSGKNASSLRSLLIYDSHLSKAYKSFDRSEGWEGSLLCKKEAMGRYAFLPKKEDTPVLLQLFNKNDLCVLNAPYLYIYTMHENNISGRNHLKRIINYNFELYPEMIDYIKSNYKSYS